MWRMRIKEYDALTIILLAAMALLWGLKFAGAYDEIPPLKIDHYTYVRTSAGRLRGFVSCVGNPPREAYIFKQIPHAEPPIGRLRFRPLRPRRPWSGDWDATTYGPACLSNTSSTTSPQKNISENCIFTNVFTNPKCMNGHRKCPVLFYIHGGNMLYDSAVMFSDRQIVEKYASDDVVFVIPAYRLGIFGAFNIGDQNIVPLNLNVEDVIFALEWTKREIAVFGGDKRRITVMGNSAGASITELLMMHRRVPTSMFQQAIVSSTAFSTLPTNSTNLSNAILEWFNCTRPYIEKKRGQVDCLRNVDEAELLEAQRVLIDERGVPFTPLFATKDLPVNDKIKLLRQIKPRTLWTSVTKNEFRGRTSRTMGDSCRNAMQYFNYKSTEVYQLCLNRYYPNQDENEETPDASDMAEMGALHSHSLLLAVINAHKGKSFYLNRKGRNPMSYHSTFNLANHSNHADDMLFFFGLHWINRTYTPVETLMDNYYPHVIKNFLRTGVPESMWKPVRPDGRGYFDFDLEVTNSTSETSDTMTSHLRLLKWPRFIADEYDDPEGEHFWLIKAARIDADSMDYEFKPKVVLNNGMDDATSKSKNFSNLQLQLPSTIVEANNQNKTTNISVKTSKRTFCLNPWWLRDYRRQKLCNLLIRMQREKDVRKALLEQHNKYYEEEQKTFYKLRHQFKGKTNGKAVQNGNEWYNDYFEIVTNKDVGINKENTANESTYQYDIDSSAKNRTKSDISLNNKEKIAFEESLRELANYFNRYTKNNISTLFLYENGNKTNVDLPFLLPFFNFSLTQISDDFITNEDVQAEGADPSYYDALESPHSVKNAMQIKQAVEFVTNVAETPSTWDWPDLIRSTIVRKPTPILWLTSSVIGLVFAIGLIVVATRCLFRFKHVRRGVTDEYLTETTRIISPRNINSRTKYIT